MSASELKETDVKLLEKKYITLMLNRNNKNYAKKLEEYKTRKNIFNYHIGVMEEELRKKKRQFEELF